MKLSMTLGSLLLVSLLASSTYAQGWGNLKGKVVVDGTPPALADLVKKGDNAVKDANVCAVKDLPDQSLIVSEKGELANCFVYLYSREEFPIHPNLIAPPKNELVFDQKSCDFIPHMLVVRTGRNVRCISSDDCAHNVHTYPLKNPGASVLVSANDKVGFVTKFDDPEILPMKVTCDIHPWMTAWWFVVNHPYVVLTDKDGNFEIKDLPEGTYNFRVWHERTGYVKRGEERSHEFTIVAGKTIDAGSIKVDAAKLQE